MTRRFSVFSRLFLTPLLVAGLSAQVSDLQSEDAKVRKKAAQRIGDSREGDPAELCRALSDAVGDPVAEVRSAVVVSLIKLSGDSCVPGLIAASRDANASIQSMAVDGMVNQYVPEYVKFGILSSLKGFGSNLKGRFAEPEPLVVEQYVEIAPAIADAVASVITGGSSNDSRANAARAAGILRARRALPDLKQALKSRNTTIIVEAVRSLEKIREPSVGPDIVFLLRDPDPKVQAATAETAGQLRVKEAADGLVELAKNADKKEVRRAALIALAKIPDNGEDKLFLLHLRDKDKQIRAAAAEGIGRAGNRTDLQTIQDAFANEKAESPRLSMAFALVLLGDRDKVSYLIDGLESTFHRLEARPFLVELARDPAVLSELYTPLTSGTRNQRIHLAHVISRSGNRDSRSHLERLTKDLDERVAEAAQRELKNLDTRLGSA